MSPNENGTAENKAPLPMLAISGKKSLGGEKVFAGLTL
jgi:hypothetical protein